MAGEINFNTELEQLKGLNNLSTELGKENSALKETKNLFSQIVKIVQQKNELITTEISLIQQESSSLQEVTNKFSQIATFAKTLKNDLFPVANLSAYNDKINDHTAATNQSLKANVANTQTMNNMATATGKAATSTKGFFNVFNQNSTGILGKLNSLQAKMSSLRYGAVALFTYLGGKQLYDWLLGTNAQIEVLQKSLEVTMKSAAVAEQTIRQLRSYAALTPFVELETFKAGEMLASNQMDVNKWIRVAGDLASAKAPAGVELQDVINVITRINSGDFGKAMIRLRQMGISINDLKSRGLEFSKNNTFLGSTDEMLYALESIIRERFGGLTETLGQTAQGMMSTIKDFVFQLGLEFGDESFGKFKTFLQGIRDGLQDFKNSVTFETMVSGFNEALNVLSELKVAFDPILTILGAIVKFAAMNLPLVANLIKAYIINLLVTGVLGTFRAILANWVNLNVMIASQTAAQLVNNAQTATTGVLNKGIELSLANQNVQLTRSQLILTKIVAMMRLKGKIADETAIKAAANSAIASGTAGAKNATLSATGGAVVVSKLGGLLGTIGMVLAILPLVTGVVTSITGMIKEVKREKKFDPRSSQDYERMIGENIEELKTLEDLNNARGIYNTVIKQSQSQLNNLNKVTSSNNNATSENTNLQQKSMSELERKSTTSEKLISSTEELSKEELQQVLITQDLSDAKSALIRVDEQIVSIAPELATAIYNNTGKLRDEADAYDYVTQKINENINARKLLIDDLYQNQRQTAKYEYQVADEEIASNQRVIDAVNNNEFREFGNSVMKPIIALIDSLDSIMGLSYSETASWGSKYTKEEFDKIREILSYNGVARDLAMEKVALDNATLQRGQQQNQLTWDKEQEALSRNFVLTDANNPESPLLRNGKKVADIKAYEEWLKSEEDRSKSYIKDVTTIPTRIDDIMSETKTAESDITTQYDIKLNKLLIQLNGDTDDVKYTDLEKQKNDALSKYWQSVIDDIKKVSVDNKYFREAIISTLDPTLQALLNEGIGIDEISIASILIDKNLDVGDRLRPHVNNIKAFMEFVKSQNTDMQTYLKSMTGPLDKLELTDENAKIIQRSIDQALLNKTDALADNLDAEKKEDDLLNLFNDKWDPQLDMAEVKKDIALQNKEISGSSQDSASYKSENKRQTEIVRTQIFNEMSALRNLLPKLTGDNVDKANLQLLQLQKQANALLLEIKNNTAKMIGEFNKPSFLKSLTYYDFYTKNPATRSLSIANANFAIQIDDIRNFTAQQVSDKLEGALAQLLRTGRSTN